ncbi:unnamed protein product, partial [Effrenium voratum]
LCSFSFRFVPDIMLACAGLGLLGLGLLSLARADQGCGYQCRSDSECGSCGSAGSGRCSCPDAVLAISCTCISAPSGAPEGPSDVKDSVWPRQWTANVETWTYSDFSNRTSQARGKFYYDAELQRSRADWKPYIDGRDAVQVWISGPEGSRYYVKSGILCISFGISDPGMPSEPVGLERADWMQRCQELGFAKYIGREQVRVDGQDQWADHWSCHVDYEKANQSITFQNWHSLAPKGLPLRVTGGNSAPNAQKGSPRLNTAWYSNFSVGPGATKPEDFQKPNFGLCIPVGEQEVEEFFGHPATQGHLFSGDFHRRARFLPHASPRQEDMRRARQKKPSSSFLGSSFSQAMEKLNAVLLSDPALQTKPCGYLTTSELHATQRLLFYARSSSLDAVYRAASDSRQMVHVSPKELLDEQEHFKRLEADNPEVAVIARDGACHEVVMWYIHHLTTDAREAVKPHLVLPLLPGHHHGSPTKRYSSQVSCAVCHTAPEVVV